MKPHEHVIGQGRDPERQRETARRIRNRLFVDPSWRGCTRELRRRGGGDGEGGGRGSRPWQELWCRVPRARGKRAAVHGVRKG